MSEPDVRGERALELSAYTHWMPLPASPIATNSEGKS